MRTLQAQLQDLADWIAGVDLDPEPTAEAFSEGALRVAWRAVHDVPWQGDVLSFRERCLAELRMALAGYPGGRSLAGRIERTIPHTVERPFRSLAEIARDLRPVQWLWPNWLPLGMITLLAARPGAGKSLVALDLAQRIITGQPWPDATPQTHAGTPQSHAATPPSAAGATATVAGDGPATGRNGGPTTGRNVIYVDGENIPEVHNARAQAWGLPRENLYMLLADEADPLVDLSTPRCQELLAQMVYRLEPALVIVDSLGAVMGKGENAVEDVRGILGFLSGLAQHHGAGLLLIHHLRKSTGGQPPLFDTIDPDQIRGSGHVTVMSRVAWGLTTVQTGARPDPNGPRRLQVIKSNLARHPDPLGILLEPLPGGDHVRVVYDQAAPEAYKEPAARDAAEDWLVEYLEAAGDPVPPKQVVAAAQAAGFSRAAVFRAREAMRDVILNTGGRRSPGNCWRLASDPT